MSSARWLAWNHGLHALTLALAAQGAACIPPETSFSADAQVNDVADAPADNSADAQANDDCPLTSPACDNCCGRNHEAGALVFNQAWSCCVCTMANCLTQCGTTDCSNSNDSGLPTPGDPCDICENSVAPWDGGGVCGPAIASPCNSSPDCIAYYRCEQQCY